MKTKIILAVIAVIAVIALVIAGYAITRPPKVKIQKEYVKVPEIRTVTKIKRVKVPVKEVEVIEKEKIVEVLKEIPQAVKDDPNKQITATGIVEPHKGKTDVIATFDTQTGKTELLAKARPLPFAEFLNEKEFGVRYGVSTGGQVADIYGRWIVGRLGNAHFALYGEAATKAAEMKPEAKAMIDISMRW